MFWSHSFIRIYDFWQKSYLRSISSRCCLCISSTWSSSQKSFGNILSNKSIFQISTWVALIINLFNTLKLSSFILRKIFIFLLLITNIQIANNLLLIIIVGVFPLGLIQHISKIGNGILNKIYVSFRNLIYTMKSKSLTNMLAIPRKRIFISMIHTSPRSPINMAHLFIIKR